MERDVEILAIQVGIILDIALDHLLLLGMNGDQHATLLKDTFQRVRIVDQHISRRRAEEKLQARNA